MLGSRLKLTVGSYLDYMIIPIGKHSGKSVEWLVLNRPDYVKWVLKEPTRPGSGLASVKAESLRLISLVDEKPIIKPCHNCSNTATRFTGYQENSYTFYAWCETCDPYRLSGAVEWKLTVIRTYKDVLNFIERRCDGRRGEYRLAINTIAMAKGFPERSSEAGIQKFLGEVQGDSEDPGYSSFDASPARSPELVNA